MTRGEQKRFSEAKWRFTERCENAFQLQIEFEPEVLPKRSCNVAIVMRSYFISIS